MCARSFMGGYSSFRVSFIGGSGFGEGKLRPGIWGKIVWSTILLLCTSAVFTAASYAPINVSPPPGQ